MSAIVGSAALLYVGFYNAFAFQQRLVCTLNKVEKFFNYTFQIGAIGGQIFNFNSIAFTKVFQRATEKFTSPVSHNFCR